MTVPQIVQDGKLIRAYEPSPGCVELLNQLSGLNIVPSLNTDGLALDSHDCNIAVEVVISEGDGTSLKGVKIWLYNRASNSWHDPEEGVVTDLHTRPGMLIAYVLADPWLYERVYIQVTQNDGAGTISAYIISN